MTLLVVDVSRHQVERPDPLDRSWPGFVIPLF